MDTFEITPRTGVDGEFFLPGSKSYSGRALVLASLAEGITTLEGISDSEDTNALITGLQQLGVSIHQEERRAIVTGTGGKFSPINTTIDVGPAGTTMRFLTAFCCLVPGEVILRGSERMHERPIRDLVSSLKEIGAEIDYLGKEGCPPLRVRGFTGEISNKTTMNGDVSSQYFTALMLIASALPKGLTIQVNGQQISQSYINMTFESLSQFDIRATHDNYQLYKIPQQKIISPQTIFIEGDASGASYFWAIAAVTGGKIRIKNISPDSVQGDVNFPKLLEKMGCHYRSSSAERWIEVESTSHLKGIECDMENMPDSAQTLAAVAAFAQGKTHIEGLQTLRHKETDRCAATQQELAKLGIQCEVKNDAMTITGGNPTPASIATYEDHRMAMSFAVIASKVSGIQIQSPQVVKKSFPTFWEQIQKLGFSIQRKTS